MALTFPVDKVEPGEVPAFRHIFERFPDNPEQTSLMLRYLVYRFDPRSEDVRKSTNIDEKRRIAEGKSGWKRPDPVATTDEEGNISWSEGWQHYMVIEGMFFECMDDLEFKYLVSLEIAIDNCNAVIRSPIPHDLDEESKAKAIINIHKASDANDAALDRRRKIIDRMADGDESAAASIASASKSRRRPISPEGMLGNGR